MNVTVYNEHRDYNYWFLFTNKHDHFIIHLYERNKYFQTKLSVRSFPADSFAHFRLTGYCSRCILCWWDKSCAKLPTRNKWLYPCKLGWCSFHQTTVYLYAGLIHHSYHSFLTCSSHSFFSRNYFTIITMRCDNISFPRFFKNVCASN